MTTSSNYAKPQFRLTMLQRDTVFAFLRKFTREQYRSLTGDDVAELVDKDPHLHEMLGQKLTPQHVRRYLDVIQGDDPIILRNSRPRREKQNGSIETRLDQIENALLESENWETRFRDVLQYIDVLHQDLRKMAEEIVDVDRKIDKHAAIQASDEALLREIQTRIENLEGAVNKKQEGR